MTIVTLRLSLDMTGADKNNFVDSLLLTKRQVAGLLKAFANSTSKDIILSKTQLFYIKQLGGFLHRLLGPFMKSWLATDEECANIVSQECVCTIRINSSSLNSRCRNSQKNLMI